MIYSVGIGPGGSDYLTPQASKAIQQADVIVGYSFYLTLISHLIEGKELLDTGMKKERQRAQKAFEKAESGKLVAVVSSGDSGVYGMASLLWEMKLETNSDIDIEVVPGISAMFGAAAKLGAPLGHDFCSISMSDLLTPWATIEKRIHSAALADFITAIYNPHSKGRFWQLLRLKALFLEHRSPETPVGIARQVGREDEKITVTTLAELDTKQIDMFTVVIIGNSQTKSFENKMITPRGYYKKEDSSEDKIGRRIMNESFRTILSQINTENRSLEHLWVALHCIHTTADFSINELITITGDALPKLHEALYSGNPPAIITDVLMVTKGIRKALVEKLGITVKCYLNDERVPKMAEQHGITRTQAGIRLAVEEYPNAIYAFGNAPTALIELIKHIRNKKATPIGVIGAPVGFVNVKESKWQLEYGCPEIPSVIINGNKGGSNVAATIINSILSYSEAEQMHPGEGV